MSEFQKATEKQALFIRNALSGEYRYLATGGGIRGTKTFTTLATLLVLCRVFPRSRWAVVRKDLPTIRRNVMPSWEKIRPQYFMGPVNRTTWTSTATNGSQVIFFPESLSEDPELNRWKGLEVNGFLLEEANELSERSYYKAIERAGAWIIPRSESDPFPKQPPPLILFTFNPCDNWPRQVFYEPHEAGTLKAPYYYLPATVADNPFVSDEYRESLKNLPDREYQTFVLGKWGLMDDPAQLISLQWVLNARNTEPVPGPRKMGVDVARYGDDATVFAFLSTPNCLSHLEVYQGLSLDQTADHVMRYSGNRHTDRWWCDPEYVNVDGVGMGAGVVDICRSRGAYVQDLVAGAKAVEREDTSGDVIVLKFKNLRSQMWWEFREKLRLGKFVLPQELDPRLISDLTVPRYTIEKDKMIVVESKDDIKKRLGRSTDYGDAVVQAAFEMPDATLPSVVSTATAMPFFEDFSGEYDG